MGSFPFWFPAILANKMLLLLFTNTVFEIVLFHNVGPRLFRNS